MTPSVVRHWKPLFRIGLSFWIKTLSLGLSSECHWCLWRPFPVTDSGTDSSSQRDFPGFCRSAFPGQKPFITWQLILSQLKREKWKPDLGYFLVKIWIKIFFEKTVNQCCNIAQRYCRALSKRCDYNFLDIDETVLLKIFLSPNEWKLLATKAATFSSATDCLFELMVIDNWSSQWRH